MKCIVKAEPRANVSKPLQERYKRIKFSGFPVRGNLTNLRILSCTKMSELCKKKGNFLLFVFSTFRKMPKNMIT